MKHLHWIVPLIFSFLVPVLPAGAGWEIETVDDGLDVGTHCGVVVDSAGAVHVSYYDEHHSDLKYAMFDGVDWLLEYVDTSFMVGKYSSVAVDSMNEPRISYYNESHTSLMFAQKNIGVWSTETVDWGGEAGSYTSLKIDASDRPFIAYMVQTNTQYLAYWTGPAWAIEEVSYPGYFNSLEIGAHNFVHAISYWPAMATLGELYYHHKTPAGWETEKLNSTGCKGVYGSLELDSLDSPYIASYDCIDGGLYLHSQTSGSWSCTQVDSGQYVGSHCDLLIDGENRLHISYHDGNAGTLKYATWTGSVWHTEVVDNDGFVGTYTAIDKAPDGTIHIVYRDEGNKHLKHAWTSLQPEPTPTFPPGAEFVFDLGGNMVYSGGDYMDGILSVSNPGAARTVDTYVLLEISGIYWFAPGWTEGVDFFREVFAAGESRTIEYLTGFVLPIPLEPMGPFYFYAAGFQEGTLAGDTLISNLAVKEFMFQ